MVVVTVNPTDAEALGMALALPFANLVFLARPDVGVIIEDRGAHAVGHEPLDDCRGAGRTTSVEENLRTVIRNEKGLLFHACKNTKKGGYGKISSKRKGEILAFLTFFRTFANKITNN